MPTIHYARHAIGLDFYGALAVAYDQLGVDCPWEKIVQRAEEECERMEAALQTVAVDNEPNPVKISWKC